MLMYFFLTYAVGVIALLILGVFIYDIHMIRQDKKARLHPYATWRRKRPPVITYVVDGTYQAQTVTIQSIRESRYKHISIITTSHTPYSFTNEKSIVLPAGYTASQRKLVQIVRQMNFNETSVFFITPTLRTTETISNVLYNYATILNTVLIKARNGLHALFPHFSRLDLLVHTLGSITQILLSLILIYSTYLAIFASQPAFLLTFIVAGAIYGTVAIFIDERLRIVSKIYYLVLSPMSYIYFYVICLTNIVRIPRRFFYDS